MKKIFFSTILIIILIISAAAESQNVTEKSRVVESLSTENLRDIVSEQGYGKIETDSDGDLIFKIQTTKVILMRVREGRSLLIRASWTGTDADHQKINDWNSTKLYCRAYLDSEGDPVLEIDLDLDGGITIRRIEDYLKTASILIPEFIMEVL